MKNKLLIAVIFLAGFAPYSGANIIVSYTGIEDNVTYYNYMFSAQIPVGDVLNGNGNTYVTFYDVPQEPYSLSATTGWTPSYSLIGKTPSNLSPTDDASLYNVSFTYSGSTKKLVEPLELYFFIYQEIATWNVSNFQYVWQDYRDQFDRYQLRNGLVIVANGGQTETESNTSNVPTPATIALFGLGLAGVGWTRRKKV